MNTWACRAGVLGLAAPFLVVLPFLIWGYPYGNDFEFHMNTWADVRQHWSEGVFFPRWAGWANYGFGEPRFIFYPPASWILGPAISLLLPWRSAPGAFVWLAVTIAGITMYQLARLAGMRREPATMAAFLSAANPYHLLMIYQRGAFSELLASAVFPLLLFFVIRLSQRGWKGVAPLALTFGTIWLINAPAAVIAAYSAVLAGCGVAAVCKRPIVVFQVAASMLLGLALAGFYIVPAAFEQQWVTIRMLFIPGLRVDDNFLFSTSPAAHFALNRVVSIVATAEIGALASGLVLSRHWKNRCPEFWWVLLTVAAVSVVLMLPVSLPIWNSLPKLLFVQFPWRWLAPLNTVFAWICAATVSERKTTGWIPIVIVVLGSGLYAGQSHWRSQSHRLARESIERQEGYWGAGEYAPIESDQASLPRRSPEVVLMPNGTTTLQNVQASVHVDRWFEESKAFISDAPYPTTAMLRLLNYPGWVAQVDGRRVPIASDNRTGQAMIALPAGKHQVEVRFGPTPDRSFGSIISLAASVVLLVLLVLCRDQQPSDS